MDQTIMGGDALFKNVMLLFFQPLITLFIGIAFLYFLYGGLMFMAGINDPEKREKGKRHLFWGTIGLFIMLSVGGILSFVNNVIGGMF